MGIEARHTTVTVAERMNPRKAMMGRRHCDELMRREDGAAIKSFEAR